jgi:hypothetical protein
MAGILTCGTRLMGHSRALRQVAKRNRFAGLYESDQHLLPARHFLCICEHVVFIWGVAFCIHVAKLVSHAWQTLFPVECMRLVSVIGGAHARKRPTTCTKHFFHFFEKIFLKGEKKSHFSGI